MSELTVITGGASGIGWAVTKKLLARGRTVAILDKDSYKLEKASREVAVSERLMCFQVDVRNPSEFKACITEITTRHAIEALVNNVGGNTEKLCVESIDLDYFLAVINDNLVTTFIGTNIIVPHMKELGYGRIVNLASIAGRTRTHFTNAAYVAAKAGVIGLTKQSAAELAPFGIAVNAVAHGAIATDRIQKAWDKKPDKERNEILNAIPLGRLGTIEEASEAVVYLSGPQAGYCIGSIIDVNGGLYI